MSNDKEFKFLNTDQIIPDVDDYLEIFVRRGVVAKVTDFALASNVMVAEQRPLKASPDDEMNLEYLKNRTRNVLVRCSTKKRCKFSRCVWWVNEYRINQ